MRIVQDNVYNFPKYYDLVYGSDWKAEFDFLLHCFEQHAVGDVRRVFEPACGTGRLIYRLAKHGFECSGIDLNPRATAFCNARAARHGLAELAETGDMTRFQLPTPVDAAFNTINSFRHLNSEKLARDHLTCMGQAIRPGGIYVLGLHLSPIEGETCDSESWSASRGHLTVNTRIALVERNYPERYERYEMILDVYMPTDSFRIEDDLTFRTYTAEQMIELIGSQADFQIESIYDFRYDVDSPIELEPDTEDAIFVLKRN